MGTALIIIILGFSVIFGNIMFHMTSAQVGSSVQLVEQYENAIARNALESVNNVATSKLHRDFENWRADGMSFAFGGATATVTTTDVTGDSVTQAKRIQVKTIVTFEGRKDSSVTVLMQPAYSYYYSFTNKWPGHLTYDSGDTLPAPIFSNQKIEVQNSPVFLGKVSSSDVAWDPYGNATPKFHGGVEFRMNNIPLPDETPLLGVIGAGGDQYDQNLWLTFFADGTYKCSTDVVVTIKAITDHNGTLGNTADKTYVKGVVNGQITVYSNKDIFIEDSIIYADDPRGNPDSDDYLALIAGDHVIIPLTAPQNIQVHAAIIAKKGPRVTDHDEGAPRGTLTFLGSMTAEHIHKFGTFSGSTLLTGFDMSHVYDPRLRVNTPPYFPRMSQIQVVYRSN